MIVKLHSARAAMASGLQNSAFYGRIKALPVANPYNKS